MTAALILFKSRFLNRPKKKIYHWVWGPPMKPIHPNKYEKRQRKKKYNRKETTKKY